MIDRKVLTVIASILLLACQSVCAQQSTTVIGPSNAELAAGARELLAGNAEEGVRLSLQGLKYAASRADKLAGMSNLCAGYFMLKDLDEALLYCNREPQGVPSYHAGKVTRLHAWLEGRDTTLDGAWFYSDSHNDLPLMELVDNPVAVDPDDTLLARAREQGWPVLSLRG